MGNPHDKRCRPRSPETKAKLSAALKGRKLGSYPKERCEAISKGKRGRPMTDAQRKALEMAIKANCGRTPWNKGKKLPPLSVEHRAKIGAALVGKPQSDAKRAAVSKARKGKPFSESHRRALSEVTKRRWDAGQVHKICRSKIELRAGELLAPFGFTPQFRIPGYSHPYDYGNADARLLIEVNGCFWHSHDCGERTAGAEPIVKDAEHARRASEVGFKVVTLWQCQESEWPLVLKAAGVF